MKIGNRKSAVALAVLMALGTSGVWAQDPATPAEPALTKTEATGLFAAKEYEATVDKIDDKVETHSMAIKNLKKNKVDQATYETERDALKAQVEKERDDRKSNEKTLNREIKKTNDALAKTNEALTKATEGIDGKADKTYVDDELAKKVDQDAFATIEDKVETHGMAIKHLKKNKVDQATYEAERDALKEQVTNEVKDRKSNEKTLNREIKKTNDALSKTNEALTKATEGIDGKADKTYVDGELAKKVDQDAFATIEDKVETHGMAIKHLKKNKVDQATYEAERDALKEQVTNEVNDRKSNEKTLSKAIDKKADKDYVDEKFSHIGTHEDWAGIADRVGTNEKTIKGLSEDLAKKADKTFVDDELAKKADKTFVDGELAKKADKTFVDDELAKKADKAFVDGELAKKADKTFVDDELAKKADKTFVDGELAKTNAEVGKKADKAFVDGELAKTNAEVAKKADKTYVDNNFVKQDKLIKDVQAGLRATEDRLDKVGAMSAAMAGMMPLDYLRGQETGITASAGHYGGQTAVALGGYHYFNRDVLMNGGVAFVGSEMMGQLGVTVRLGHSDASEAVSDMSLEELRYEVARLLREIEAMKAQA